MRKNYTFTSESVSEGHPDKLCDRVSDSVLDAFLSLEPNARVACETFASTSRVIVGGEVGLTDPMVLADTMGKIDTIVRIAFAILVMNKTSFTGKPLKCKITCTNNRLI